MRKKIYLICIAGYPNYGDELILKSWLNWLHRNFNDKIEIVIDSIHKNSLYFMVDNELDINDEIVNYISKFVNSNFTSDYTPSVFSRMRRFLFRNNRFLGDLGKSKEIPFDVFTRKLSLSFIPQNELSKILDSNIIHFLGGGYLNSIWKNNLGMLFIANSIKQLDNKNKVVLTGAGMLPLDNVIKSKVSSILEKFDFAQARDVLSAETLSIDFGYDDAFLCIENEIVRYANSRIRQIPDVMVCIQSDLVDKVVVDRTIKILKDKIEILKIQGLTVGYVEALPHSDHYAFTHLSDIIQKEHWFSAKECIKFGLPVKKGQLWFSTRFHHHLVAASAGAYGVAISYKPGYYDLKHKSLLDLGTGWNYFSPYAMEAEIGDPLGNQKFMYTAKEISRIKQTQAMEIYNF